jgi:four helix bundle protein
LIARGSCAEVESQLFLAETFDYISVEQRDKPIEEADEIMRILTSLIQKYKS